MPAQSFTQTELPANAPIRIELLEALFDHLPVALQLYDAQGRSVRVNGPFLELFGAAPPPEYDVRRDLVGAACGAAGQFARAVAGEIAHIPPVTFDARDDGQAEVVGTRPVRFRGTCVPVFSAEGAVTHVLFIFENLQDENTLTPSLAELRRVGAHLLERRTGKGDHEGGTGADALVLLDLDLRIRHANDATGRLLGVPSDELAGVSVFDTIPRSRVEDLKQAHATLLRGEPVHDFRVFMGKHDHRRRFSWNAVPIADEGRIFASGRDVTKEYEAQAALSAQARLLERLARGGCIGSVLQELADSCESAGDGSHCDVMLLAPNREVPLVARVISARVALFDELRSTALLGWVESQNGFKSGATFFAQDLGAVLPTPVALAPLLDAGVASFTALPMTDADGRLLGCISLYRYTPDPPSSHALTVARAGAQAGSLAILRARTDDARLETERTLQRSQERLAYAQRVANVGHWELDARSTSLEVSEEVFRIFGLPPSPAPRLDHFWGHVHPDDRERLMSAEGSGEQTRPLDLRILRPDGSVRFLHAIATVLPDEHGATRGYTGTVQDVTHQRELHNRLAFAERLASVGTLAAGVAHEINNPLAYVVANLGFLAEQFAREDLGRSAPEALRQALVEAREGVQRVQSIVRDLKTFSRTDDAPLAPVDVQRVLTSALTLANNELRHRAEVVTEFRAIPPVDANESRLGQVFLNLLVNAAQSLPEGEAEHHTVRVVTSTSASGCAQIDIHDTGAGIHPDLISRVFDPFFTTKPAGVGTGLGLPICHGIVTAFGGNIEIDSVPGKGTRVRVVLPPAQALVERSGALPDHRPVPARGGGRVLVIDDEPFILATVQRVLGDVHEVSGFDSATEALRAIEQGAPPDVILCDVMMPQMNGIAFYEQVSQRFPELSPRVAFMTGGAFTPRAAAFLKNSGAARIDKPFEASCLRAFIAGLLRQFDRARGGV